MSHNYSVRWIPAGQARVVEELMQASSPEELASRIAASGGMLLRVQATAGAVARARAAGPRLDIAWWCRELVTLLRAGMTAVEAIETLQLQVGDGARAEVQRVLLQALHEGKALSKAMDQASVFPQVLIASVTASERTSTLADALDDYIRYDAQVQQMRKQAVGAAIYPAVVMAIGVLIALFLLVFVLPRFSKMYATFRGQISAPTQGMLWVSNILAHHFPEVLLSIGGLALLAVLAWRWRWWHALGRQVLVAVPWLRQSVRDFRMSQLYQSLALTLRGGYSLVEAIDVCVSLKLGHDMTTALTSATEAIRRGKTPSQAFADMGLADGVAERLLRVGERTGQFAEVLQTLADRHAKSFATFVQRATRLVEPLLLLSVALVVGGIVVMMYMPIFDIANGMR